MRFKEISSENELNDLLDGDTIIFKHSDRCGISQDRKQALTNMDDEMTIYEVEVREQRGLSDHIAEVTGISHESPQLLIVRQGDVVWHASHMAISPDKIREHL